MLALHEVLVATHGEDQVYATVGAPPSSLRNGEADFSRPSRHLIRASDALRDIFGRTLPRWGGGGRRALVTS